MIKSILGPFSFLCIIPAPVQKDLTHLKSFYFINIVYNVLRRGMKKLSLLTLAIIFCLSALVPASKAHATGFSITASGDASVFGAILDILFIAVVIFELMARKDKQPQIVQGELKVL